MQHAQATPIPPWSYDTSNYRCLECGTLFTTEIAIEAHIQKFHAINSGYTCPHCQRGFKDNWHLSKHIVSHTMGEEPKIMCNICKKPFKDNWQLNKHQMAGCGAVEEIIDNTTVETIDAAEPVYVAASVDAEALNVCEWVEERSPALSPSNPFLAPLPKPRLSNYAFRPADSSPNQDVEYFCKVCGEVLQRLHFCSHLSKHFPEIYLPRLQGPSKQVSLSFIQQNDAKGGCQSCAACDGLVKTLRSALGSLEAILGQTKTA